MRSLMLFLLLVMTTCLFAQDVYIPDANFKAYLIGNTLINTNGDTEIQVSEANAFTGTIWCQGSGISDLTGIEAFTALTTLECDNNQLTSLDVNLNTALFLLDCSNNQLTSLNTNGAVALSAFYCYENQLTCLNIKNGNNSTLVSFNVELNPNLTCIEVDDVAYSTANWTATNGNIDPGVAFSTNCNNACSSVGISEYSNQPKKLIRIIDYLGRETTFKPNTPLIYQYDDGSVEKVIREH